MQVRLQGPCLEQLHYYQWQTSWAFPSTYWIRCYFHRLSFCRVSLGLRNHLASLSIPTRRKHRHFRTRNEGEVFVSLYVRNRARQSFTLWVKRSSSGSFVISSSAIVYRIFFKFWNLRTKATCTFTFVLKNKNFTTICSPHIPTNIWNGRQYWVMWSSITNQQWGNVKSYTPCKSHKPSLFNVETGVVSASTSWLNAIYTTSPGLNHG